MKKILIATLIILLTILPYKPEIAEQDCNKLGNTPGNIKSDGNVVENEHFCYYSPISYDDNALYKENKETGEVGKIAVGIHGMGQLNIYGNYIYYCDGFPAFLQRMTLDGKRNEYITFREVRNVAISGNRIYYMISEFDDDWGKVYSCELNGKRKKYLAKEISEFCVDGDTIYYTNMEDEDSLWAMDIYGKNKRKLGYKSVDNLNFDEDYIYYNEIEDFRIYRMNKQTLQSECINETERGMVNLYGDWIYYCDDEKWLSRISKDGKIKEKLFAAQTGRVSVVEDSVFFQISEGDYDMYRYDLNSKEVEVLSK